MEFLQIMIFFTFVDSGLVGSRIYILLYYYIKNNSYYYILAIQYYSKVTNYCNNNSCI